MNEKLEDAILLTSTCIRTYDSLYYQYRQYKYNEPAKYELEFNNEGELNFFHKIILEKIEQRPVNLTSGCYAYYYHENLYIIIGGCDITTNLIEKIYGVIKEYKKHSSTAILGVIWCCFSRFYKALYRCFTEIEKQNKDIFHDIIVFGLLDKIHRRQYPLSGSRYCYIIILKEECSRFVKYNNNVLLTVLGSEQNNDKCFLSKITFLEYVLMYIKRLSFNFKERKTL